MTESTPPSSTKEFNKVLDAQILKQEPRELDAPWFGRRYFATMWSTVEK